MCLAIPMQIEAIDGEMGTVEATGIKREVSLSFIDDPSVGDYVLIHAGFAIQKIDEHQANETIELLNQMAQRAREMKS